MKKKRKYNLFVSYNFQATNGWGFGNKTTFYTYRPRLSTSEIREMEQIIMEENKYKNVVIMNYQFN